MTVNTPVSDPAAPYTSRQRERRLGFAELVASLTRVLDRPGGASMMRGAFEEMVRRIVPVRAVRLRETSSRWSGRREQGDGLESVALEIPGSEKGPPAFLEATFAPGCRLGDWDFQMLGIATHIGALVLEIERNRAQLAKAGLLTSARQQPDGAAPLIGSTTVMRLLRSRIERVAATDFTVLVEGPRSPQ
jgi:hypothetical protein